MNITSTIVGITIMGAAAPSVMQMTLAPVEAQARAKNFSKAESSAVTFSAEWEGKENPGWISNPDLIPNNCEDPAETSTRAYDITCKGGSKGSKYEQAVTRSFRLSPDDGDDYENPNREYAFEAPKDHSHVPCQVDDPWGVIWYNKHLKAGNMKACIPPDARTKQAYLASDPADWLYDLSDYGWGKHPNY
ncbi:hypothetical protein [Synechococcus sp. MIT S9508]|uniref:hypothetical protein n=1 Tax=Synechococcus sp. MIT S9508 TaxID=1801629 RepID=UPI0007BC47A4|nr:hypothetical protein [Synechococcus sp. MIT S9508]KZR89949.1 hypothetical protein MITS9508_01023 [Synechococcus sp. MIT S9508]